MSVQTREVFVMVDVHEGYGAYHARIGKSRASSTCSAEVASLRAAAKYAHGTPLKPVRYQGRDGEHRVTLTCEVKPS